MNRWFSFFHLNFVVWYMNMINYLLIIFISLWIMISISSDGKKTTNKLYFSLCEWVQQFFFVWIRLKLSIKLWMVRKKNFTLAPFFTIRRCLFVCFFVVCCCCWSISSMSYLCAYVFSFIDKMQIETFIFINHFICFFFRFRCYDQFI